MNLAAETHVDNSIISPQSFIQTNIMGTFNLLEASRKYLIKNKGKASFFIIYLQMKYLVVSAKMEVSMREAPIRQEVHILLQKHQVTTW